MSHFQPWDVNEPLGAGSIIADTFNILFRNFLAVMIMGFFPSLAFIFLEASIVSWDYALFDEADAGEVGFGLTILLIVLEVVLNGLITALLVQIAYDAKLGRPMTIGAYVNRTRAVIMPIFYVSIAVGILVGLGALALVLPGLWLLAVFYVAVPAVVMEEEHAMDAMERSSSLTKEYRWPIVGIIILMYILVIGVALGGAAVIGLVVDAIGAGLLAHGVSAVFLSCVIALTSGFLAVSAALVYARLRQIKEGVGVDELASVFE